MLSTARERLRRECLRGRIFGFTVQQAGAGNDAAQDTSLTAEDADEDIESLFLKLPTSSSSSSINQEWNKNSWRRTEGKKSRGRVRGIAKVFETGEADELGRRKSLKSTAELDEVIRVRRNRQESTDSDLSTNSSFSNRSGSSSKRLSLPVINFENNHEPLTPISPSARSAGIGEAGESESEAEDTFGSPANKVNWASVEPLALEETAALSEDFFAEPGVVPSSSSSSPSTPCASSFQLPSTTMPPVEAEDASIDAPEVVTYQSRILPHVNDAYAAIRSRKESDLSEVTDELSEEHLAYWNKLPAEVQVPRPLTRTLPTSTPGSCGQPAPLESCEMVGGATEEIPESAATTFAESDGNIITMKKHQPHGSLSKRTRSVEDFGSLKLQSVHSCATRKSSTRGLLKHLFEEDPVIETVERDAIGQRLKDEKKGSRRLNDLFRGDDGVSATADMSL